MGDGARQGHTERRSVIGRTAAVGAAVLVVVSLASVVIAARWVDRRLFGPTAAEVDRPPSEREALPNRRSDLRPSRGASPEAPGGPSTVPGRPPVDFPGPTTTAPPAPDRADDFELLRCTFAGRAVLSPGLPYDVFGTSRQSMRLAPGSTFACRASPRDTSGDVEMEAAFDGLGLFSGVGRGGGTIRWDGPVAGGTGGGGPSVSGTYNEIELLYPEIVVWVTIEDGPYAGFRGKLVLSDWERIDDAEGRIAEIVFEPTEVVFNPV